MEKEFVVLVHFWIWNWNFLRLLLHHCHHHFLLFWPYFRVLLLLVIHLIFFSEIKRICLKVNFNWYCNAVSIWVNVKGSNHLLHLKQISVKYINGGFAFGKSPIKHFLEGIALLKRFGNLFQKRTMFSLGIKKIC